MAKSVEPTYIRQAYTDFTSEWRDVRDEGATDMRFVNGDAWTPADRAMREDAGRPCISPDELNQYLNQYNNSLRQSKRAIQLIPKGDGANDKDARRRSDMVRGIENDSNAQDAYITAAENAAQRSYGFALIRAEYEDDRSFDQKVVIKRVGNPDSVLLSPHYETANACDVDEAFYLKRITQKSFKEKYPKAEKVSFSGDDMRLAPGWIGEKDLQIAEFWKIHKTHQTLLLVHDADGGPTLIWESELKGRPRTRDGKGRLVAARDTVKVLRERRVEVPEVIQTITNGIENLEENPWAGSRIPIISCFGKELWMDEGSGPKRHLLSMIRLARDPQMLFAYLATQECEEAGMTPKTPFLGYAGQFEKNREAWEVVNKQPFAFLEVDIVLDSPTGSPLPLPARPQFQPNFQSYEVAKESARRSIQAAMGISPLPTTAQRNNEKSGIALEKIQTAESIGSFHFADNFTNGFLHNMGWQVNELISKLYDTEREVPIEKADGTYEVMSVVGSTSRELDDEGNYDTSDLPDDHLHTGKGNFDVTIATGPSYQSEREEQAEFGDTLIQSWQALGIPPQVANKILAILIRMRNIGSFGDEIASLLSPPDPNNLPPEAQAVVLNLQAQLQQALAENQQLHLDRAGRVLEQNTKLQIEQMKGQHSLAAKSVDYVTKMSEADKDRETKLAVAEITTKAQNIQERLAAFEDLMKQFHDQAHDFAAQMQEQQHQQQMAQMNAQQQQATAAQQQTQNPPAQQPQNPPMAQ